MLNIQMTAPPKWFIPAGALRTPLRYNGSTEVDICGGDNKDEDSSPGLRSFVVQQRTPYSLYNQNCYLTLCYDRLNNLINIFQSVKESPQTHLVKTHMARQETSQPRAFRAPSGLAEVCEGTERCVMKPLILAGRNGPIISSFQLTWS